MDSILPPADAILEKLEIEPKSVRTIKSAKKRSQYRAVINWLTRYSSSVGAGNLEQVRGWLEAFHHLCELEAWEKGATLLFSRLETETREELHDQLNIWGHHTELNQVYSRVANQISPKLNAIILNSLDRLWTDLGDYDKAIDYHKQSLAIDEELGQMQGVGASLGNLGIIYSSIGEYETAIQYHEQHLKVARKIKDK
ncbi:tetratricopeptide repeat protein [Adonisia turfae]|uniref:Tetratricopeptide repeat protein n=1 Tax=Adonisia turfae CCMR0081 TaxID=2292702 RepID=A0A6M0RDU6_9CYAN|nr:tetratricopeptide repeat protein [Adonisia turfae]NEZ54444.1 tetratricopeptide repeat protein [Adonisia turfae CCMR0081]